MFPLLRYFAIASAVLLLLTTALLVTLYRQTSLHHMMAHAEDTGVIIARSLQSSLWPEFGSLLRSPTLLSAQPGLTHPNKADVESLIGQQISGITIRSVTVYNAKGVTVISTENARAGQDAAVAAAIRAALAGETTTTLVGRDILGAGGQAVEQVDVLVTAVPVLDQDGKAEAVIEIQADASAVMHHLFGNTVLYALILLFVFGALYISLLLIVRHANRTVARQHRQILAAKDELTENNLKLAGEVYDRKHAELALRDLNEGLEARVAERTAELHRTQEDLLRKQRLASLGQLIGTVGHDLRNPLGVIRNALAVMRERSKKAGLDLERQLERSERSLGRCEGIIHDLLDHTRIPDLDLQPTTVDAWLRELLDEQSPPDGIRLRCELTASGIEVPLDDARLGRVIINLFDNACQAMAENPATGDAGGKGCLTVATRVEGGRLEISFRDTGPGIDPDLMTKIFEPLFTTRQQGVGLGLPMVKQIVELHGGIIDIASETGKGTCVTLRMPTRSTAEAAA